MTNWRAGRVASVVLLVLFADSCASSDRRAEPPLAAQDSTATLTEVRASMAGEGASGRQTYSYRGLYAGLSRAALEQAIHRATPADSAVCRPSEKKSSELECSYTGTIGDDAARVHTGVVYAGESAREITIVRDLPLDVDGVDLARALSDAFERQTSLLDRRDASYGHHQAQVRMGTVGGARSNYVDVTIVPHLGREQLTVKLSRAELTKATPVSRDSGTAAPAVTRTHER